MSHRELLVPTLSCFNLFFLFLDQMLYRQTFGFIRKPLIPYSLTHGFRSAIQETGSPSARIYPQARGLEQKLGSLSRGLEQAREGSHKIKVRGFAQ